MNGCWVNWALVIAIGLTIIVFPVIWYGQKKRYTGKTDRNNID